MSKKFSKAAIVAAGMAGALVLSVAGSSTAFADPGFHYPASVFYTGPGNVAGVGSDTIQDVENGLAQQINATAAAADKVESWDAVAPGTRAVHGKIATKGASVTTTGFERPNGSGEGQAALSRAIDGGAWPTGTGGTTTLRGKVDYARSSSGTAHFTATEPLTFIPFARDAVSYAYVDSTGQLASLTPATLTGIYKGTTTSVGGTAVHPWLPQAGSGTRKFFLKAIGVTDDAALVARIGTRVTEENNGVPLTQGSVVPFSAAQWIAQKNGQISNFTGSAKIGSIKLNGTTPVSPVTGTTKLAPNLTFYNSTTFGRDVYNVVATSATKVTTSPVFHLFVTTSTHTALVGTTAAKTVITKYGFLNVTYAGDATNARGHTNTGPLVANPSTVK